MLSDCCDGHGGQDFFQTFAREPDTKKFSMASFPARETETLPGSVAVPDFLSDSSGPHL